MIDETDKRALSVKVAQLYYQNDWRQSRIAAELNLSRPTVSRLLQYARESGIVQIKISNPLVSTQQLAAELKDYYHLDQVIVVPSEMTASGELLELVGAAAAEYIETIVKDDDTIGLAWGKTIHAIAQHLSPEDVHGVTVVQLKGSVANTKQKNYAFESVNARYAATVTGLGLRVDESVLPRRRGEAKLYTHISSDVFLLKLILVDKPISRSLRSERYEIRHCCFI